MRLNFRGPLVCKEVAGNQNDGTAVSVREPRSKDTEGSEGFTGTRYMVDDPAPGLPPGVMHRQLVGLWLPAILDGPPLNGAEEGSRSLQGGLNAVWVCVPGQ